MYQRVLVPLDGSELAQTALMHAMGLCRSLDATLVILHVHVPRVGSVEAAQRYLDFVKTRYVDPSMKTELVLRRGSIVGAILGAVEEHNIDVITMATHGRSGIQRAVYGSVAEEVLRRSSKPVLLVRVAGERSGMPQPTPVRRRRATAES